jgi:hypothetical protein
LHGGDPEKVGWLCLNALKYIKSLEEVGFRRDQAEAQVQILIDAIEGELVTKGDLGNLKQEIAHQFTQFEYRIVTKLGVIVVTTTSLAVALMSWLLKSH